MRLPNGRPKGAAAKAPTLAEAFTADRWRLAARRNEGVEIRIAATDATVPENIETAASRVVDFACSRLGISPPPVRAFVPTDLPEGEFEVAVNGAVRISGSLETPWEDWWHDHPTPGREGRTGLAPGPSSPGQAMRPELLVARAVEEALWDDFGLLLSSAASTEMSNGVAVSPGEAGDDEWVRMRRELLSRRVPLPGADELASTLRMVEASDRVAQAQQAASLIRPYEIVVRLGPKLDAELDPKLPALGLADRLGFLHEAMFTELGLGFSRVEWLSAAELEPHGYEIAINGTPRARGELPPGMVLVNRSANENELPYVQPANGQPAAWVDEQSLAGRAAPGPTWSSEDVLVQHLSATLREAAAEFADLAWTHQLLDRMRDYFEMDDLVRAVDAAHSREVVTCVLQRLVEEGVGVRDMRRILQRLLDADSTRPAQNGSTAASELEPRVLDLAETVRAGIQHRLTHAVARGWDAPGDQPLRPVRHDVDVVRLSEADELAIQQAVADGSRSAVYGFAVTGGLLRALRPWLSRSGDSRPPVVVTPRPLRCHVRRLIAAQFPRVSVLADDEVAPEAQRNELGRAVSTVAG
jgi:FHIPEP family